MLKRAALLGSLIIIGASDSLVAPPASHDLTLQNTAPVASYTQACGYSHLAPLGFYCVFKSTATDADGSIASCHWEIAGVQITTCEIWFNFATEGWKTVYHRVTDNLGASDDTTGTVYAHPSRSR